ncbi:MAG: RodZ domain-containing protein [Syntrophorhabdales bacterium]|jgi:cytoskeleton protein RodZ
MPFDLDKVGQLLKTAREEKGLTLEDVSGTLFIRKSTIGAIESGDWQNLPHIVYVRGYIVQYASFLNIVDVVKPALLASRDPAPEEERQPLPVRPEETPRQWGVGRKITGATVVAAIFIGFLVLLNMRGPGRVAPVASQTLREHRQTASTTGTATDAYDRQEGSPYQPPGDDSYRTVAGADRSTGSYDREKERMVLEPKKLMIACQERTWVRVVIDGSDKKEFMLNPEEVVMLNAKEKFDLLIGNAAGVRLIYNGKDIGLTGGKGEVKHVNLS